MAFCTLTPLDRLRRLRGVPDGDGLGGHCTVGLLLVQASDLAWIG